MLSNEVCRRAKDSSTVLRSFSKSIVTAFTVASFVMLLLAPYPAQAAATETILHNFACGQSDGCYPESGVVLDSQGNLYGTTYGGGTYGAGVVFKLSSSGTLTILHSFNPSAGDGSAPYAGVVFGPGGNLYGTTYFGGSSFAGTVYEVTPSGTETVLYNFTGGTDGCEPQASVVFDSAGNLYGTAPYCGASGWGTVFKIAPGSSGPGTGTFTPLYSFTGGTDGGYPYSSLLLSPKGNLYGTTYAGGANGVGTVFEVTPSGTESVLHSFNANGEDGFYPYSGLIADSEANLYGTTSYGGTVGVGAVFEVTPSGTETIIHSFKGGKDGINPYAGLVAVGKTKACGVTEYGGTSGVGTVYCGTTSGTETVLHSFTHNGTDGYFPYLGSLAVDKSGNLYGTTVNGGNGGCGLYGCGVVFEIVP